MSELRLAVIGVGRMGSNHARVLSEMESVCLAAVCDANRAAADKVARRHLVPKAYTDIGQMLGAEKLDGVVIAVPTSEHLRAAELCLRAKLHVLIEKPPAMSLSEVNQMEAAARKAGVKIGVVLQCRTRASIQAMRKAIADGRFGKLLHADM